MGEEHVGGSDPVDRPPAAADGSNDAAGDASSRSSGDQGHPGRVSPRAPASCEVKALPAETSNIIQGLVSYAATAVDYVRGQFRLSWP
jgi:hypothetical protein